MVTSIKQPDFKQTALRISRELHAQLHAAASLNGRSYNAEIVGRLQASFEPAPAALPPLVDQAVKDEMEARGASEADALLRLVLAGQSNGGQVLSIRIAPGMTLKEVSDAMNVMVKAAPNVGNVVVERE